MARNKSIKRWRTTLQRWLKWGYKRTKLRLKLDKRKKLKILKMLRIAFSILEFLFLKTMIFISILIFINSAICPVLSILQNIWPATWSYSPYILMSSLVHPTTILILMVWLDLVCNIIWVTPACLNILLFMTIRESNIFLFFYCLIKLLIFI